MIFQITVALEECSLTIRCDVMKMYVLTDNSKTSFGFQNHVKPFSPIAF